MFVLYKLVDGYVVLLYIKYIINIQRVIMIYASSRLKSLIQENNMELLSANIKGASIDIRIDSKAYIRTDSESLILTDNDDKDELLKDRTKEIDLAKGFQLQPGQYLYGKAFETIKVPENACGLIMPRSTFARIGLILPISQFANPGYAGKLPIIIYNASPVAVEIPPYYRVAQIIYAEISGKAIPYNQQADAKYHNEANNKADASLKDEELILKRLLTQEDIIKISKK